MKRVKVVTFVAWLSAAAACFAVASANRSFSEARIQPQTDAAAIYTANCAKCHGDDGKAKTAKGKRVEATDFTSDWNTDEERGIRIVTKGKGQMPSFKDKLTVDEIRDVFRYVVKFRK